MPYVCIIYLIVAACMLIRKPLVFHRRLLYSTNYCSQWNNRLANKSQGIDTSFIVPPIAYSDLYYATGNLTERIDVPRHDRKDIYDQAQHTIPAHSPNNLRTLLRTLSFSGS